MDWLKHMNNAISYIEENLSDEICIKKAAQLAQCSQYHFMRMFSYIVGISLSEYVRHRRITKAAFDLQNGDKVIDVGLRYGYKSPTAFNRAFQAIHGISPSAAQNSDTPLKAFPSISLQITVKGVEQIDYRIIQKDAFRAVGIRKEVSAGDEEYFEVNYSQEEENAVVDFMGGKSENLLGVFVAENDDGSGYYYLCVETDAPAPDGMFEVNIPKHKWAVFSGGYDPSCAEDLFHRIYTQWLPTADYGIISDIEMEVYSKESTKGTKYDIWLPIG